MYVFKCVVDTKTQDKKYSGMTGTRSRILYVLKPSFTDAVHAALRLAVEEDAMDKHHDPKIRSIVTVCKLDE